MDSFLRSALLKLMFAEPSSTVMREHGLRDARAGKPRLSSNTHYLRGYELALELEARLNAETGT